MAALLDHLWQSTLLAAVIALMVPLFRRNSAALRYSLWFTASVKFLLPFSLLALAGRHLFTAPIALPAAPFLATIRPAATPFASLPLALPAVHSVFSAKLLLAAWAVGAALMLLLWLTRWVRLRHAMRGAVNMAVPAPIPVRAVASFLEPGLVGIFRPVILLPRGIGEKLSATELGAILAHELCHLRRRDNLTAAIHMLVEALFWFHPLVWWIGGRLVEERERACDEGVLATGNAPLTYAEGILKVCRFYVQSPRACASGVSGADLQTRLVDIMANRAIADLESGKGLLLGLAAAATVALPLACGMLLGPATVTRMVAATLTAPSRFIALPSRTLPEQTVPTPVARPALPAIRVHAPVAAPIPVTIVQPAPVVPDVSAPVVVIVPAPSNPVAEAVPVCRMPQQLPGSRFSGPKVCLSKARWSALAAQGIDIAADGHSLVDPAAYEKNRSINRPACSQSTMGTSGSISMASGLGTCF